MAARLGHVESMRGQPCIYAPRHSASRATVTTSLARVLPNALRRTPIPPLRLNCSLRCFRNWQVKNLFGGNELFISRMSLSI